MLHLKIALTKHGRKPLRDEVVRALDFILEHGQEPEGWEFHITNWERPGGKGGSGGIQDLRAFKSIIEAMRDEFTFASVRRVAR